MMRSWPVVYEFGIPIGNEFSWFAWRPVRLWYGRWVWLRNVRCQRVHKLPHLDGPDWAFWTYDDCTGS